MKIYEKGSVNYYVSFSSSGVMRMSKAMKLKVQKHTGHVLVGYERPTLCIILAGVTDQSENALLAKSGQIWAKNFCKFFELPELHGKFDAVWNKDQGRFEVDLSKILDKNIENNR